MRWGAGSVTAARLQPVTIRNMSDTERIPTPLIKKVIERFRRAHPNAKLMVNREWPVMLDPAMSPRSHPFLHVLLRYSDNSNIVDEWTAGELLNEMTARASIYELRDTRWPRCSRSAGTVLGRWERRLLMIETLFLSRVF